MKSNIYNIVPILLILVSACTAKEKTYNVESLKGEIDKVVQPLVQGNTNIGVVVGVMAGDQKLVLGCGKVTFGVD